MWLQGGREIKGWDVNEKEKSSMLWKSMKGSKKMCRLTAGQKKKRLISR